MTELFVNLPEEVKRADEAFVELALGLKDLQRAAQMVAEFANTCHNVEEQEFIDFYFNLKLEQMKNESNTDRR